VKCYDKEPTAFLPHPKEGVLRIFIALALVGFEPANLVSNDKHANHYTTDVTGCRVIHNDNP
jgi:hypothetical protein